MALLGPLRLLKFGHISSHLKKNAVLKNPFTLSMGVILTTTPYDYQDPYAY